MGVKSAIAERTMEPIPRPALRKMDCPVVGCAHSATHYGLRSQRVLAHGCEWHMRMWVRDGLVRSHLPR